MSQRLIAGLIAGFALTVAALGQAANPTSNNNSNSDKPLMAEQAFKNITVLKGITSNEFMGTMSFFSAALGANCNYCHVEESGGDWAKYADDSVPQKAVARRMVLMTAAMNKSFFGGKRALTCYSCHRGSDHPKVIPNLDELYGEPLQETSDNFIEQSPRKTTADQIFAKYLQALGDTRSLAEITSITGKGSYKGFDTDGVAFELYAKMPNQRAMIVHTPTGDSTTVYDGKDGWISGPRTDRPVTLAPLTGTDLEAAKVDADAAFPARLQQAFTEWRVGFPMLIDDRQVEVLEGRGGGHVPTRFYFDKTSGLLVRMVRYSDTAVGLNPTRYDYSDYKTVAGVKMPHQIVMTWTGGRASIELKEIQVNSPIEATKFAKPVAPVR